MKVLTPFCQYFSCFLKWFVVGNRQKDAETDFLEAFIDH